MQQFCNEYYLYIVLQIEFGKDIGTRRRANWTVHTVWKTEFDCAKCESETFRPSANVS